MCHCALIDKWIILFYFIFTLYFVLRWPVIDGMLKFKNCAGAEDIQSVDSEHDMNTTDSWLQPVLWTLQTLKSTDGQWPTEVHTLNATDTELTLNATDSEPHWQLNTRLNTTNTE